MKKKILLVVLAFIAIFVYFNYYTYIQIDNKIKIKKYLYELSNINKLNLDKKNYEWIIIHNGRVIATSLASYHVNKYNDVKKFLYTATKGYKLDIKNDFIDTCYITEIKPPFKKLMPKTLLILNYPYIFQVSDYNPNRLNSFINDNCKSIIKIK